MKIRMDAVPKTAGRIRIFVVDGSAIMHKTYDQLFRSIKELKFFELVSLESAERALAALTGIRDGENKPDVIILDVQLSGMGALDFLARLKSDARWRSIPVILSTSTGDSPAVALATARGAFDVIVKPLQTKVLVGKIEKAAALSYSTGGEAGLARQFPVAAVRPGSGAIGGDTGRPQPPISGQ